MKILAKSFVVLYAYLALLACALAADKPPRAWLEEFPKTNFAKKSIELNEIVSGGPPRDGIPAIDKPLLVKPDSNLKRVQDINGREPVLSIAINGVERAYPLRFLIWHEIVNDEVGGIPIIATFCPLCNSAIVFKAQSKSGKKLTFGTTGRLRKSDLLMYDRETESWWQQFTGQAVIGKLLGEKLEVLPARLEAWSQFLERTKKSQKKAEVLVALPPENFPRNYGINPYASYDSNKKPFLYRGALPKGIPPLARVVSLADRKQAVALEKLREKGTIKWGKVVLEWQQGQSSALDSAVIADGKEVGSVYAWREDANGARQPIVYFVEFAFAFHAFFPDSPILQ